MEHCLVRLYMLLCYMFIIMFNVFVAHALKLAKIHGPEVVGSNHGPVDCSPSI